MKTSRDLMLLAAVAFKNGKFDDSGALFAASLSASDADEMIQTLNCLGNPDAEPLEIESESVSSSSEISLSQIVQSISAAIGDHQMATASDEDSEEEDQDEEEEDEEEEDEDLDEDEDSEEEDEEDEESTSSTRPAKVEQTFILQGSSPIKLKQQ
jgi:ribonuclease E